jgi:uncharacterized protein with HEPN domain
MPRRYSEYFIVDLLIAINKIKRYSKKLKSQSELLKDEKNYDAIIRELEVTGEAIKNILDFKELKGIIKSEWQIIVDFRNVITHEYFGIDPEEIFNVIKKDIVLLEKEIEEMVVKIPEKKKLVEAIECAIKDLSMIGHLKSVQYLKNLKKKIIF